jgi:hypothetical protein
MSSKPNSSEVSRRSLLKSAVYLALGSFAAGRSLADVLSENGDVALVVLRDDAVAAEEPPLWAIDQLQAALVANGASIRRLSGVSQARRNEFCIVAAWTHSPLAQVIQHQWSIVAPAEPESLCLAQGLFGDRAVLLAAGSDALGLVYALTELADRVRCHSNGTSSLLLSKPVIERPASRTRSVMRAFSSEVEDKTWFYDRDYWRSYLTMLVTSRMNRVSLTLGMGYNYASGITDGYFVFPYPFFLAVPGYEVTAKGLTETERRNNLRTLQFIGEEAALRGMRFQLGLWTLAYRWPDSPHATYRIEGLTDDNQGAYCRDALAALLEAVPTITGVTFRVHEESGIPMGQHSFWQTQFSAIARCGRRVEIDLHAKNMAAETLQFAISTGQPTVVSPKYCGEHLGLPYHPASIRDFEMAGADLLVDTGSGLLAGNRTFTRYGYADFLAENRTWDVVFRVWPGTQRFLLSADPALFAGYSRSASFCGAAGIEWPEPLFFKGRLGSGLAGGRCAYAAAELAPPRDFEKYLNTYRLWGRLGYDPDADPETWRRALRREFGAATLAIENALALVTRVLPLFTLAHAQAADCQVYWPDIYTNMPMADLTLPQPDDTRDPKLFGNVSPFDPQLFQSPDECADDLAAGIVTGKYSPLEVAQWLEDIAVAAWGHLQTARALLGISVAIPAFRRVEEDVLIQRGIALFFAAKLRAAVLWRLYVVTGYEAAGDAAIARYTQGRDAWAAMAGRAGGVYRSNISFGGERLQGHWLDRIPAFDADIADLHRRRTTPVAPMREIDQASAGRIFSIACARPVRPTPAAEHKPADGFHFGQSLAVVLRCAGPSVRRVVLHYRHVDQAERWQSSDLKGVGAIFSGEIPGAYTMKRFPLQYYFQIETDTAEATLHPALVADFANVPYYIVRHAAP